MHLIAKVIRMSHAKFHYNRLRRLRESHFLAHIVVIFGFASTGHVIAWEDCLRKKL